MNKLAKWLSEHAWVLGDGGKDTTLHLWAILATAILMSVFVAMGWIGTEFEVLMAVLCLGATIVPPIVAVTIAAVRREKWNPWYWFPIGVGVAIGGIIAIVIGLVFGWCSLF